MPVPHFFQASEQTCGAACLRMLFATLGATHDEATIAQCCGTTALGCTVQDLVTGALALGFNAALLRLVGQSDAILTLSKDAPFVAMIDLSGLFGGPMFQWHFVVPVALVQGEVVFTTLRMDRIDVPSWMISWLRGPRLATEEYKYGRRSACS
jgi:ABC-type bacteriocin/lantibiotic exporter with double-glycine peptidase domain